VIEASNEKTDKKISTKLIAILPILTLLVLVYGAAKQFVYYYNFNLDIFSFLEISELLPQTVFDLFFATIYIIAGWTFAIYYSNVTNGLLAEKINNTPRKKIFLFSSTKKELNEDLKKQIKQLKKQFPKVIIPFIAFHFMVMIMGYQFITDFENPLYFISFIAIIKNAFYISIVSFISIIVAVPFAFFDEIKDRTLQVIVTLAIYFTIIGGFNGWFKYLQVVKTNSHRTYSITINNKIIASDNEYFYIGKSKSYVFFYCTKDRLVTSYPMSLITEMSIGAE
jgi:hypothetical protein